MKKIYLALLCLLIAGTTWAQIVTTSNNNGNQLAQTLAGNGVTITNVQLNCPTGAAGTFNCVNCNLGMQTGIMLTTGYDSLVWGPNNTGAASGAHYTAGDNDLTNLVNADNQWWETDDETFDACVLEFDMQVLSDSVEFRYIFGSEEYLEWVDASYNDIFAFFISGPGIAGQQNIALVPGTTIPVAIDNVNDIDYPQYYVDNQDGFTAPNNGSNYYIQYDGFTTVLTAKRKNLQPCQTYHLKLAIADVGDEIYDSGVFLEANSLTSNGVQVDDATTDDPGVTNAVETCVDGSVRFTIDQPVSVPTKVKFGIGGTAVNGVDYTWIADSITIPANDTQVVLTIHPLSDGQFEFIESVVIYLYNACNNLPYDSSILLIIDSSTVYAGPDTTVCAGTPLMLNATQGVTYSWTPTTGLSDPNIANPTFTPTTSITYTVTSVAGACVTRDSVRVNVVPPPFTVSAGPDVALCPGQTAQLNAVITGNPLPGSPFQNAWSPAAGLTDSTILNPVANPSGPATYVITVRSGQCIQTDSVNITPGQVQTNTSSTNETCFGYNNGSATVTVTSGQTPYTYTWSNAGAGNVASQNTLTAGTYYVTVSDATNCTASDTFTITSPPAIYFNTPTVTNATCYSSTDGSISITATGGAGSITYAWSNNGTGSSINNLGPNTYIVTATDANSCTADTSIVVGSQPQIVITSIITNVSCFGGNNGAINVTTSGGAGGFTFAWSNGAITEDISNLTAGQYILTVTDANGCTQTHTATITQPAQLSFATPTIVNVSCFGGNDGSITVNHVGGTSPYTYTWSPAGNTQTISNLIAGAYDITVSDANGCSITNTYNVTQPAAALTIADTTLVDATCFGSTDGSIVLQVTGGTTPYNYVWSNGAANNPNNTNIAAGPYSVTIRDANQCSVSASYVVNQPTEVVFSQVVHSDVKCFGGNDGTIDITVVGGGGSYTYTWSNGGNVTSLTNLTANTYYVTATDAAGCSADTSIIVAQPTVLTAAATATNVSCNAGSDGTANVVANGGTPPYTYSWSNGRTTAFNGGLPADNYYVTVTDANLCTVQAGTSVSEPTSVTVTYTAEAPKCVYTIDGTITASATGGTPSYSYTLQLAGNSLETNTSGVFIGLAAGTYNVLATDSNNCPSNWPAIVPPPTADEFTYVADTTSCYGDAYNDGSITVVPINFVNAPYTYSIDGGAGQFSETFYNLSADVHSLHIVSNNGCVTDTVIEVPEPIEGFVEVMPTDTITMAGETLQMSSTFINYPTSSISAYVWSPSYGLTCGDCPNPVFNGYNSTTYVLTVIYHNGCIATASTDITVNGNPPIYVPNAFTPNGDGSNDVFYLYSQQVKEMDLKVFNRWGEKVFESTNQFYGWDGMYKGVQQPMAVYTYVVEVTYLNGKKANQKGTVNLIR